MVNVVVLEGKGCNYSARSKAREISTKTKKQRVPLLVIGQRK